LATRREEGGELFILIEGAERISRQHVWIAAGESGARNPLGVFWDLIDRASM
jgi:hypothetical protein